MAALRHAARRVCGRVLERPYSAAVSAARAVEEEPRRLLLLITRGEMSLAGSYRRFSCFSAASRGPPTNHRALVSRAVEEPRLPRLVHGKMPPRPCSVYRLFASSGASHPPNNDKCNVASAVSQVNNVDPVSLEQQIKEKKQELIRLLTLVQKCSQENKELLDLLSNTEKSVEDQAIEDYRKRARKQFADCTMVLALLLAAQYVLLVGLNT